MEEKPSHSYIIQSGDKGAVRLELLAKIMWPFTRPLLLRSGLVEGMKCLDLGCGNGETRSRNLNITGGIYFACLQDRITGKVAMYKILLQN